MNMNYTPCIKPGVFSRVIISVLAIIFIIIPLSAVAAEKIVTQETLLDRIQIEDMMIRYYVDISAGSGHNLSQYFTEDAGILKNGISLQTAIYRQYGKTPISPENSDNRK